MCPAAQEGQYSFPLTCHINLSQDLRNRCICSHSLHSGYKVPDQPHRYYMQTQLHRTIKIRCININFNFFRRKQLEGELLNCNWKAKVPNNWQFDPSYKLSSSLHGRMEMMMAVHVYTCTRFALQLYKLKRLQLNMSSCLFVTCQDCCDTYCCSRDGE